MNFLLPYSIVYFDKNLTISTHIIDVEIVESKTKSIYDLLYKQNRQKRLEYLKGKKRSASIAFPRQIAMFLSRDVLNESYQRIGLEFGGRDHSTVMHSCEKIESDIKTNKSIRETIEKIKKNIS